MRHPVLIGLVALGFVAAGGAPAFCQDEPVGISARLEGDTLVFEVRTAPHTRVVIGVANRLSPGGATLAFDDALFIAASPQPDLRGMTGPDGIFRTKIRLDPAFRQSLQGGLFAQAARLGPTDTRVSHPSAVIAVEIRPPEAAPSHALRWLVATVAGLVLLAWLPAAARRIAARLVAVLVLVAAPFALGRAFLDDFLKPPFLPFGGDCRAPLEEHLGTAAVRDLHELNALLPSSEAVIFVEFPLVIGDDLLLHRLFAKRPFTVLPNLGLVPQWASRGFTRPVVVTLGPDSPLPGANVVFRTDALCAWRPAR